jgi:hypothetical protein
VDRITYYTPIIGAFVENILMRMAERFMMRRSGGATATGQAAVDGAAVKAARKDAKARLRKGGALYWALRGVSAAMYLDVLLFGRLKSGPFFARLRKHGPAVPSP